MLGKQKFTIDSQVMYLLLDFVRIRRICQDDYVRPILEQGFGRHNQSSRAGDVSSLPCGIDFHDMTDFTVGIDQVQKSNSSASCTPCCYLPSCTTKFLKAIPPIRHLAMKGGREPVHFREILPKSIGSANRRSSHAVGIKRAFYTQILPIDIARPNPQNLQPAFAEQSRQGVLREIGSVFIY